MPITSAVPYYPGVVVKYRGPTDTRGSRFTLELPGRNLKRLTFSYMYELSHIADMAISKLIDAGFSVESQTNTADSTIVLVEWEGTMLPELWKRLEKL